MRALPMLRLLQSVPDPWGPKLAVKSGAVTRTRTGPNEIKFIAPAHMALVMFTPQPDREVALNSDRKSSFLAPAGTLEIVPANAELFARWRTQKENLLVALAPDTLSRLAEQEFQSGDFELQPAKVGVIDEKAHMLADMIRDEFRKKEQINEIYLDSLITVFSTHLLRNYSSFRDMPHPHFRGGMSAHSWKQVNEYIHAHLSEKLSLEELARVADLSPSHFLRAFRETAGQPPHQYVLAARLALAERLVSTTDAPLATIAAKAGFSSHSHMTAAMRRNLSITPRDLRGRRAS